MSDESPGLPDCAVRVRWSAQKGVGDEPEQSMTGENMTVQQPGRAGAGPENLDEETVAARARALSSPVRWRILRACLDEDLTNKELADRLGVNPGSMLHHVRTLVGTGFLAAGEHRRGQRNALEIPYRTTELVWAAGGSSAAFGDFLLSEVDAAREQGGTRARQVVIRADDDGRAELERRIQEVLEEFRAKGAGLPEGAGGSWSVVVSVRPLGS